MKQSDEILVQSMDQLISLYGRDQVAAAFSNANELNLVETQTERFTLRMTPTIKNKIGHGAEMNCMSQNEYVLHLLEIGEVTLFARTCAAILLLKYEQSGSELSFDAYISHYLASLGWTDTVWSVVSEVVVTIDKKLSELNGLIRSDVTRSLFLSMLVSEMSKKE